MKIKLIVFLLILVVSACTFNNTAFKNGVVLLPGKYQLENEYPIALKINYSVVKSLRPIFETKELLVDTGAGAEFLDNSGKYISVYNQKPNELVGSVTELLGSRVVDKNIILSYFDHLAVLGIRDKQLLNRLEKPENDKSTKLASTSPNGRYALAFGYLWDLTTNKKLDFYRPNEFFQTTGNGADFSPDNKYFVISASLLTDAKAQLWDLEEGKLKYSWKKTGINHAMFSPDGKIIFFIIEKPIDKLWKGNLQILAYDVETGSKLGNLKFASPMSVLPFAIDGEHIITGHKNGDIHIWSFRSFSATRSFNGKAAVTTMVKDAKGRVWCGFGDGKLIVLEKDEFSLVHTFKSSIKQLAVLDNKLVSEEFDQKEGTLNFFDIVELGL